MLIVYYITVPTYMLIQKTYDHAERFFHEAENHARERCHSDEA